MNGEKLKPCPFCGHEPAIENIGDMRVGDMHIVYCRNHDCCLSGYDISVYDWNTRAESEEE